MYRVFRGVYRDLGLTLIKGVPATNNDGGNDDGISRAKVLKITPYLLGD